MNILTEKQLRDSYGGYEIINSFLEKESYFKSLEDKSNNELSEEDKIIVFKTLGEILLVLQRIEGLFANDYYISKKFRKKLFFNRDLKRRYKKVENNYYSIFCEYAWIMGEIYMFLSMVDGRFNMYDVKLSYNLTYLIYIMVINYFKKIDLELLNKNNYKDSDIKDLKEVEKEIESCAISLKNRNKNRGV